MPAQATINHASACLTCFTEAEDLVLGKTELCGLHRESQIRCPKCKLRGEKVNPLENGDDGELH